MQVFRGLLIMSIDTSFATASTGLQNIVKSVKTAGDSLLESVDATKFKELKISTVADKVDSDGVDVKV